MTDNELRLIAREAGFVAEFVEVEFQGQPETVLRSFIKLNESGTGCQILRDDFEQIVLAALTSVQRRRTGQDAQS